MKELVAREDAARKTREEEVFPCITPVRDMRAGHTARPNGEHRY